MALGSPNDGISVMVNNNSDVLMSLFIAGFIDSNVHEIIKTSGSFRFNLVESPMHTTADSFPVDTHVF